MASCRYLDGAGIWTGGSEWTFQAMTPATRLYGPYDESRVLALTRQRAHAKHLCDYRNADAIRSELESVGCEVHDGPQVHPQTGQLYRGASFEVLF